MGEVGLYAGCIRPLLFRLDPEWAHNLAMGVLSRGWMPSVKAVRPDLAVEAFGMEFAHPIGLAAGLDKNGVAVDHWHKLGFAFAEIGTVTWHAQPGNPRPRLFRFPADEAIVNRMGFNNDGAEAVARRLERSSPRIPIGINLGKSKITPLDEAAEDYVRSFRVLRSYGSYFVVNVSSPNTPGLRSLQDREPLQRILSALREEDGSAAMLLKISPDLERPAVEDAVAVAVECGFQGMIATNTTLSRDGLSTPTTEAGGLSGRPLARRSDEVLAWVRACAPASFTLIGSGGVFDEEDVRRKRALGATLVQMYTGWVYGGPTCLAGILRRL
jgi:dihydroorotate dehydrogenase